MYQVVTIQLLEISSTLHRHLMMDLTSNTCRYAYIFTNNIPIERKFSLNKTLSWTVSDNHKRTPKVIYPTISPFFCNISVLQGLMSNNMTYWMCNKLIFKWFALACFVYHMKTNPFGQTWQWLSNVSIIFHSHCHFCIDVFLLYVFLACLLWTNKSHCVTIPGIVQALSPWTSKVVKNKCTTSLRMGCQ